jgi:carbonic anhydrase/acetyltransferase-like protein (isoleucine patch superfamily)
MDNLKRRLLSEIKKGERVFIADTAKVFGEIIVGDDVSIWYNVVIRADVEKVVIGKCSNVQDGTVIHVTKDKYPTSIGEYVTIGHNATLHGCTIRNNVLIGIASTILDNSIIEENCIVAAGSLIPPNKIFPPNSLIMGNPAKVVKTLSEKDVVDIRNYAERYVGYKNTYLELDIK